MGEQTENRRVKIYFMQDGVQVSWLPVSIHKPSITYVCSKIPHLDQVKDIPWVTWHLRKKLNAKDFASYPNMAGQRWSISHI
jgi:hypothetical protein